MQVVFVAHESDATGVASLELLLKLGQEVRTVKDGESVSTKDVALFGVEAQLRNNFLRVTSHRDDESIAVPPWAMSLPFRVAINIQSAKQNRFGGLRSALKELARIYAQWGPWMDQPEAPWNPAWQGGQPHPAFPAWRQAAQAVGREVSCAERLSHRLSPIFRKGTTHDFKRLVVTGCAVFNKPHTDVVGQIVAEKRVAIVDLLAKVANESGVEKIQFVLPDPYLLCKELRDHFHPFMFMDLAEVEKHTKLQRSQSMRLLDGVHARTDDEVAKALQVSCNALLEQIVEPAQKRTSIPIVGMSCKEYLDPYIKQAYSIAQKHREVAERIYRERVKTRPSYKSLDAIDRARGLERTVSNNAFYIAEAMFLSEHRDTAIVNCEFEEAFWLGLENILAAEVWGEFRPYIGMVPQAARQPWGY